MNPADRLQFGLRSLLLVTTVVAAVLALLRPLELPTVLYAILAGYTMVIAAYLLLRGFAQVRRAYRLERQRLANRQTLEAWIEEQREQAKGTDDS
jgi:uncharacterized membrane protein